MGRRYRTFFVPLLALLLPLAVIGLLGYKWLYLEREAEARRGQEAAEAEAARLRQDLHSHLALLSRSLISRFREAAEAQPPYAPPPPVPDVVAVAYLFGPHGRLLYPDYEGAYQRVIREPRSAGSGPEGQAAALLQSGRAALAAKQYRGAESSAARILECCPSARDEFGVPFSLYAAAQMMAAWETQGQLRAHFPSLAARLGEELRRGVIGHPKDLPEIAALVKRAGKDTAGLALLRQAEQKASDISQQMEMARRLERWLAGTGRSEASVASPALSISTWWNGGRPQAIALYPAAPATLVAVLSTERLAAWVTTRAQEKGLFEAALVPAAEPKGATLLRTPLFPEAPGLDLALRAAATDPAFQERRRTLQAATLAAAVLLVLLVGYLALRDVMREVQLSSLRSNFVAAVTHELKTPLTSIRLLAETLRLKRTRDPDAAEDLLAAIGDETERLSRLVDNVLSFSRIEKGVRTYQPVDLSLPDAVHTAVQRFQSILSQSGFQLRQESDDGKYVVRADPEALDQALFNLLGNAVKYSGQAREIRLGLFRQGEGAEIRITDYGIGIPQLEQQRIFESFYRSPVAARETAGAGLGLALVRHFAEAHGGRVSVSSELGAGSTFCLWLPTTVEISHGQNPDRRG